jgi:hypothetical protein
VAKIVSRQLSTENLWEAAYSQLDHDEKVRLTQTLAGNERSLQNILQDMTDSAREKSTEMCQTQKLASSILGAVLSVQKLVGALAACDPTGHAACAWSIVSVGLQVRIAPT